MIKPTNAFKPTHANLMRKAVYTAKTTEDMTVANFAKQIDISTPRIYGMIIDNVVPIWFWEPIELATNRVVRKEDFLYAEYKKPRTTYPGSKAKGNKMTTLSRHDSIDLRGKDYLTQIEAMHYVGIKSKDTFRRSEYYQYGFRSEGNLLYRKDDLRAIIKRNRQKHLQPEKT